MWFNHSSKVGTPLCPKTIQISADPNCFIFSTILSALWCPNKCRKLKLIAIFVRSDDSDSCSTAENKHLPLIKHPPGHKHFSALFTTPFFILPLFTVSVQYLPVGMTSKQKQETRKMWGKLNSSIEVLCQHLVGFFLFCSTLFMTEAHKKLQGSVVLKQNGAVPLVVWNKRSDPIHSTMSLGFILALNAKMLWPFFEGNDCGHLLHIFPFRAIFTS